MAVKKKKPIAKAGMVAKSLENALVNLEAAFESGTNAVAERAQNGSQYAKLVARLSKKRATLLKRKKLATTRVQKEPSADNNKALRDVKKELDSVTKELGKAKIVKDANNAELSDLRASLKRATAYRKGVAAADKVLNQPKKKSRRKKAVSS
jgi:valyl-tRNA synthetase